MSRFLVEKFTDEGDLTLDFFRNLTKDCWDRKLYTDGAEWTIHEVFAHIVEVEESLFRLFSNIAEGGYGVGDDFDLDRYNENAVDEIAEKSRAELFSLFEERRDRMIKFVGGLSPEHLEKVGRHPFLGRSTLQEMLRLFVLHVNLHMRDIKKIMRE